MRYVVLCLLVASAYAQTTPQPRFDVASVKPIESDAFATRPDRTPGRFRWVTQLAYLVGYAYDLDFSRVAGSSLGRIYAVEATFNPAADPDVRAMLRTLLAERLHLQTHRVTKRVSGYALTVGKSGARLKPSPPPDPNDPRTAAGYISGHVLDAMTTEVVGQRASTMELARELHRYVGVPIWDRTGLSGRYDFTFQYAATGGDAPALSTALRDLGLTLKKQKGPLDTLIIDHIEDPSEN